MKNLRFKEFVENLKESKKIKHKKHVGEIKKNGNKYVLYVDSTEIEKFKSEKEAEEGFKEFIELL